MATLRDIRSRVNSVRSIQKITQAMKMVATAKLRKAQNLVESSRPYLYKLSNSISNIIDSLEGELEHPFVEKREQINNIAVIVVSSDKGMCGSFNTNLLKEAFNEISVNIPENFPNATVSVIPIGRKAISFFSKKEISMPYKYSNVTNEPDFNTIKSIIDPIKEDFINKNFDIVYIFSVKFINILKQTPVKVQLLPFVPSFDSVKKKDTKFNNNFIFEPNKNEILDSLIPKLIDTIFWYSILDSNASEQAARRVAMDNATTNAGELIKSLNLIYNNIRQASITSEIIEIVSGANALKSN
ncbi:MAG: ATP synthase F1 subunit gamma [Candidatus Kapaibacteriota bacterium]